MEGGRNLGRRLRALTALVLASVLLASAPAAAAPAIEQYVLDLPSLDRPDAGGTAIETGQIQSAGGVVGQGDEPISGFESLLDAISEPLGVGLIALSLGGMLIALQSRRHGGAAA